MRITTGVDIVDIKTITSTLNDPAQLQRMLHPGDTNRSDSEHLAGRIALKEATIKALGLAPGSWLSVYVHTASSGKPELTVLDTPNGLISLDGSISHHANTAIGFVVALFDDENK